MNYINYYMLAQISQRWLIESADLLNYILINISKYYTSLQFQNKTNI